MSKSMVAHGQNVFCERINVENDTVFGRVMSSNSCYIKVGMIVCYVSRYLKEVTIKGINYDCLWEPHILAVEIDTEKETSNDKVN